MDTKEKLKKLRDRMVEVSNNLGTVSDNIVKILESNSTAINVNGTGYKNADLIAIKNTINEQIRQINRNIIPSIEKELKELEEQDAAI